MTKARKADADRLNEATDSMLVASRALLGIVARSVSGALDVVTLPQFRVLVVLAAEGPLRVSTLAQRMGAVPSTFSRTLDRMVAGGWVVRTENPDSRREVLVQLTEQGRQLVDDVTAHRRNEIASVLQRLSPPEWETLAEGLAFFNRAAGEPAVEDLLVLGL